MRNEPSSRVFARVCSSEAAPPSPLALPLDPASLQVSRFAPIPLLPPLLALSLSLPSLSLSHGSHKRRPLSAPSRQKTGGLRSPPRPQARLCQARPQACDEDPQQSAPCVPASVLLPRPLTTLIPFHRRLRKSTRHLSLRRSSSESQKNACRKQKMRCEGAENPPCRRCRHAGLECLFEKPSREASLTGEAGLEYATLRPPSGILRLMLSQTHPEP